VITAQLMECGARLNEWRRSAARSGADTTLRFVCSWYEGLDLDALVTMRGGAPTNIDPVLTVSAVIELTKLPTMLLPAPL
jgi:hypothetical protein